MKQEPPVTSIFIILTAAPLFEGERYALSSSVTAKLSFEFIAPVTRTLN